MKYYLDTEFIEDGRTIDLISVGIMAEDGRELHLQSVEFDDDKASPWVKENVLPHLTYCSYAPVERSQASLHWTRNIVSKVMHTIACEQCPLSNCPWRTREQIRDEITAFLDPTQYGKPELYTWCGTYDHVALCQLFGRMIDTPEWFPHHVHDLQSVLSDKKIEDSELPQQEGGLHNALEDARHLKKLWEHVKS